MNDRAATDPQNEPRRLRERIEKLEQKVRALEDGDLIVETPRRLKLRAPNGHYYIVTATNAGGLLLTDAGISL